jgi:hypothetical protein
MTPSSHEVLGRTVTMPVEIRTASAVAAMFSVPAGAAQQLVDPTGLRVLSLVPGRATVGLLHVRYVDGDLGAYDELGVTVLVRNHDPAPRARPRLPGLLSHRLPVDGRFTLAAGRRIWGFPKELGDFDVRQDGSRRRVVLRQGGRLAVDLTVSGGGLPVRVPGRGLALRAYTHLDGVTRFTDWRMRPTGTRVRPGGARVRLGDHPLGSELAELGLPRRALFSTTLGNVQMSFGDATPVG